MKKLTDEQIRKIATYAVFDHLSFRDSTEAAIRKALALAAEDEPKPARKTWPVGPFKFKTYHPYSGSNDWEVRAGDGRVVCVGCSSEEDAEAIAFALNILPKWVALVQSYTRWDKKAEDLLAEFDKWEMPEQK